VVCYFAIVTTKVTDDILQCWLDQKDRTDVNGTLLYPDGPMKAAYGTFLEALLMIKCHDMVADQAASQYNVTWSRTTPIVVSVFDDAYCTVLTLECSHRFGMDVTGDVSNITAFRYACSSAVNPIEHMVGESLFPGGNSTSIVMGLGQMIFNGEMVDLFMSNGYFVMKSADNSLFLVLDPETGILRDVMVLNSSLSGSWCYSDQQAEWAHDLGEKLLNSIENIPWMGFIPILGINLNMFGSSGSILPESGSLMSIFEYVGVDGPAAEVLASLTRFAKNPLTAAVIGVGITTFVVGNYLCDKYNWPPHRDFNQDVQTVKDLVYNSASKTIGFLISSVSYGSNKINVDISKTIDFLNKIDCDDELDDAQTTLWDFWGPQAFKNLGTGGSDGNSTEWANTFLNTFRFIKKQSIDMYKGILAGDPVAFAKGAAGTGVGLGLLSVLTRGVIYDTIEESYQKYKNYDLNNSTSGGFGGGGGSAFP
jgi:hypothetical protein